MAAPQPNALAKQVNEIAKAKAYWARFRSPLTGASMPLAETSLEHPPINPAGPL